MINHRQQQRAASRGFLMRRSRKAHIWICRSAPIPTRARLMVLRQDAGLARNGYYEQFVLPSQKNALRTWANLADNENALGTSGVGDRSCGLGCECAGGACFQVAAYGIRQRLRTSSRTEDEGAD